VANYEPAESYPGEYFAYMHALAGDYVFTQKNKGAEIAKKIKSDKEAIDIGIGFEKDSILFYTAMKKMVPDKERKAVDELILQEQKHLRQLLELKASL
jgi:rubrerythrin